MMYSQKKQTEFIADWKERKLIPETEPGFESSTWQTDRFLEQCSH